MKVMSGENINEIFCVCLSLLPFNTAAFCGWDLRKSRKGEKLERYQHSCAQDTEHMKESFLTGRHY